jgi:hypothetical protein
MHSLFSMPLRASQHPPSIHHFVGSILGASAGVVFAVARTTIAFSVIVVPGSKDAVPVPCAVATRANAIDAITVVQEAAVIIVAATRAAGRIFIVRTIEKIVVYIQSPDNSASVGTTTAVAWTTTFSVALTSLGFTVEFSVLTLLKRYKSNRESRC